MDVPASFGDSSLKTLVKEDPFCALLCRMQDLLAFCNRPEGAGDVISGKFMRPIVLDRYITFRDPCLSRSREIRLKARSSPYW